MAEREEVGIDQEVLERELAAGKPERVARALAKSAFVRKQRKAQPAPEPAAEGAPEPAAAPAGASAAQPAAAAAPAAAGAPAATGTLPRLTPEERAARVAAALGTQPREGGGRGRGAGETHRLLAMVPPSGIQRVEKRQEDKVNTWPHLLAAEFNALLVTLAGLMLFSALVHAPLLDLANPSLTPNPSKAPWYFMGLQELLAYFHPMVAGVTIPGLAIVFLIVVPYADKNPSMRPERRQFAVVAFTVFLMMWAVLVIAGSFFRGPGFNWIWPWDTGLYFHL